jgi:hypothetical protein
VPAANLYTNPDFDVSPNNPKTFTSWTVGFSGSSSANTLIMGVTGINTAPDGPEDGPDYAYFGNGLPIGTFIDQTLTVLDNEQYTISFWVSVDPINNITENPGPSFGYGTGMQVNFGSTVDTLSLTNTSMAWTKYSFTVDTTSTSVIGEFTAWDDDGGMVFLDNIQTVDGGAVPEPATFLLAGAGLIAAGLWRKLKR